MQDDISGWTTLILKELKKFQALVSYMVRYCLCDRSANAWRMDTNSLNVPDLNEEALALLTDEM